MEGAGHSGLHAGAGGAARHGETNRIMSQTAVVLKNAIETINNSKDKNENEIILMNGFTLEGDTTEYTLRRGTTTIKGEGKTITVNSGAGITVTGEKLP